MAWRRRRRRLAAWWLTDQVAAAWDEQRRWWFKMVELGADIEEVVRECDIPLAEAEMLISVHRNKTNPS